MHRYRALLILLPFAVALAADPVVLERHDDKIDVLVNGAPFTTYYFGKDAAKPYLMPLRTASGVSLSRAYPAGNEVPADAVHSPSFEPHQRGLYFAHGNLDGLDFWQEPVFDKYYDDHGRQAYGHATLQKIETHGDAIHATFLLVDSNGREIATETQSFTFGGDKDLRTIDCEFTVRATAGPLIFGDTKEGTFGIRLGPELSGAKVRMVNSHAQEGEKQIWGKSADWVAYSGTVSGKPVVIAVLDHPKSFRHPTTWHARAYGLLAANPFGLRDFTKDPMKDGSWTIAEGKALQFRYRVLIYDGSFSASQIEEAYKKYESE